MSVHREWLLIRLRTDWPSARSATRPARCWPPARRIPRRHSANCSVVFEPDAHTSLEHYAWTRDQLVLVTLVDVASHVRGRDARDAGTRAADAAASRPTPTPCSSPPTSGDEIFLDSSGFDTPSQLLYGPRRRPSVDRDQAGAGVLRRRRHRRSRSTSPPRPTAPGPVLRGRDIAATGPGPTLLTGYGGFEVADDARLRRCARAGCGWPAAAPTWWRTSAAAASTGRAGTPRRCARTGTGRTRTSPPSPGIWWSAASPRSSSSALRAAATAAC